MLKEYLPGLSNNYLANILCRVVEVKYNIGDVLIKYGSIPKRCFIIKEGFAKVPNEMKLDIYKNSPARTIRQRWISSCKRAFIITDKNIFNAPYYTARYMHCWAYFVPWI